MGLASELREINELPLNEETRIADREHRESEALRIENKLRSSKGEELLLTWEELEDEEESDTDDEQTDDDVADADVADADVADTEEEEQPDVLLTEAGNVLIDTMLLKQQQVANAK